MSGFTIPEIKMPTPEQMRRTALNWLERIGPTLIDRWPQDVLALSAPTKFVPFPMELIDDLFEPSTRKVENLEPLAAELDRLMGWDRHFIRLNSRSPKDACWPFEAPITCSGKEALMIMGSSERVLDDLVLFRHVQEQPALICLREFIPTMHASAEYRCFVKDGELIAVSHYDYLTNYDATPEDGGAAIRAVIDRWFTETLKPRLHVSTVVFDVFLGWNQPPFLIELNPYGLSDPCWFRSYANVEAASVPVAFSSP